MTENRYSHGPVTDVGSEAMTCYEINPGSTSAAKTLAVTAGSTISFTVDTSVGHPGPLHFYMAKVPAGQTAATFNGKGAVWFKIYQDGPTGLGTGSLKWPSDGMSLFFIFLFLNHRPITTWWAHTYPTYPTRPYI
jgi:hypothetical protein